MRNFSLRFKFTAYVALALIAAVLITFALVFFVSSSVLNETSRNYLVGSVEANVDEVIYISSMEEAHNKIGSSIFISYEDGYLEIDEDFLDVINDVYTALYEADGTLLYGESPLALQMEGRSFTDSRMWTITHEGVHYRVYERKLLLDEVDDLWLRGIMPDTLQRDQQSDIARISVILMPVLLILAMAGAYLAAGRMLAPIRDIEETVSEINAGSDLKRRIALTGPDDELHRLAAQFDNMFERLDASFETERRFTSDASHELRTPMSVILAQCEYTLDKERDTDEYVDALRVIRRQGARMNGLINDMLDYTRMQQKAENYPLTRLDLSGAVREICEEMVLLKVHDIALTWEVENDIFISGNRMLIVRLLQNLLGNAYRYGKEGGSIRVTLHTEHNAQAVLSVADDGIGISEEDLPYIFDRFYRADSSRSQKGTGLGLSMVKRITELHNATIDVESLAGEGATFTVTFALSKEKETA